jgi:thiamine transport system permease protein
MAQRLDRHGAALMTRWRTLLVLAPLAFLGLFYVYPLMRIFTVSLAAPPAGGRAGLGALLASGAYGRVLWFTTWQAALSTLLTLLCALPAAYVFARFEFRGKALIQSLLTVPFVLPTVVTATAFQALLGSGGLINGALMRLLELPHAPIRLEQSVGFVLMAHVFYNFAVMLRLVGGFWRRLPLDLSEAARVLGASGTQVWRHVTLPLLAPALLAASLLVFVFCFTSFGVVLILGGPRLATLEVEIYRQAVHLFNLPLAAALSMLQILLTLALMALYTAFERRASLALMPEPARRAVRPPRTLGQRSLALASRAVPLLLLGAPLAALAVGSLRTETGWGLTYYRDLLENRSQSILYVAPIVAMGHSLAFALGAMLLALLLGTLAAAFLAASRGRAASLFDPLFMLPLSTSAVSLGFGFILALDRPPLNLRGSLLLTVIAQALVAFPFVIRTVLPAWRGIPHSLREAAAVLGANPWRVWCHVDWPILRRALAAAALFAFAISMGEFGATVMVARPQAPTLPLAIFRYLTHPGPDNFGQAMAMSCLLMATTAAGFLLLEKLQSVRGDF